VESDAGLKLHRRNVSFLSLVELFWGVGLALIHMQGVVTAFLDDLGATASFIGLLTAVTMFGVHIAQFFSGYIAERLKKRKPSIILLHFISPLPWLAVFLINYYLVTSDTGHRMGRNALLLAFIPYSLLIGALIPLYFAFISSLVKEERRARAFGTIFSSQCIAGAVGIYFVGALTSRWGFPQNYAILFLLAFLFVASGNFFLFGTKERTVEVRPLRRSMKDYFLAQVRIPLRNIPFRRYIFARIPLCAALILFAFLVKYAKERFGVQGTDWARLFAFYLLIGQALGNQIFGRMADRLGYKTTAVVGNLLAAGTIILALFSPTPQVFFVAQFLAGVSLASVWVTHMNIVIAFAPPKQRTHYIGFMAAVSAVSLSAGAILAGWFMDAYGFGALVTVGVTVLGIGILFLALLVDVPKVKEREEVVPSR